MHLASSALPNCTIQQTVAFIKRHVGSIDIVFFKICGKVFMLIERASKKRREFLISEENFSIHISLGKNGRNVH